MHATEIDDLISAEIPDENKDPELFALVKKHMLHGPCKADKCMKETKDGEKKCIKKFPKEFRDET